MPIISSMKSLTIEPLACHLQRKSFLESSQAVKHRHGMRRIRFYSGFCQTLFCNSSFMLYLLAPYRLKHKGAIPAIHIAMALANNLNRLLLWAFLIPLISRWLSPIHLVLKGRVGGVILKKKNKYGNHRGRERTRRTHDAPGKASDVSSQREAGRTKTSK